jgi:hypothetical protein
MEYLKQSSNTVKMLKVLGFINFPELHPQHIVLGRESHSVCAYDVLHLMINKEFNKIILTEGTEI